MGELSYCAGVARAGKGSFDSFGWRLASLKMTGRVTNFHSFEKNGERSACPRFFTNKKLTRRFSDFWLARNPSPKKVIEGHSSLCP